MKNQTSVPISLYYTPNAKALDRGFPALFGAQLMHTYLKIRCHDSNPSGGYLRSAAI